MDTLSIKEKLETAEATRPQDSPRNTLTVFHSHPRSHSYQIPRQPLWQESSSSMTRDRGPSHRIPVAKRFPNPRNQELQSRQLLRLELSGDIGRGVGTAFPRSRRPEHFPRKLQEGTPSPATYYTHRFMEESNYKTRQLQKSRDQCKTEEQQTFRVMGNPEQIIDHFRTKGVSIPEFKNHSKTFMSHSKNKPWQPQNVICNPGPNKYYWNSSCHKRQPRYSFRALLKRFNQEQREHPGPGAYKIDVPLRPASIKGTIARSQRTYLTRFEDGPSPNHYTITRFLEHYS